MARWRPAMLLLLAVALLTAATWRLSATRWPLTSMEAECIHELVPYDDPFTSGNFVVVDHDIFWSSDHPDSGIDFTGAIFLLRGGLKWEAMKKRFDEWMARYHRTYKEADMKKRFEEWMVEYNRTYKDEEEKERRYKLFKDCAKTVDKLKVFQGGAATNDFCDQSEDELQLSTGGLIL